MSFQNLFDHKQSKLQYRYWSVRGLKVLKKLYKYLKFPKLLKTIYLFLAESIIECKCMILNILSNSIYFVLRFNNFYLRICAGHRVYLTTLLLFFKNWPFPYTHCQLNKKQLTLTSELGTCGESIFYLKRLFSIMI